MEAIVKLPSDITQLHPFRQIMAALNGDAPGALWICFSLFRELKSLAEEGEPCGLLPGANVPSFLESLSPVIKEEEKRRPFFDETLVNTAKLLKRDGTGFICTRFILAHGGVKVGSRTMSQRGGDMRAYHGRQDKLGKQVMQQALALPEYKWVGEDSEPLDPDTVKRVTRLIICCDNALFKEQRPTAGYSEGLIHEAVRVLKKFSDDEVDYVCDTLARNREHPVLVGMITEKLLPVFGDMVLKMQGGE